MFQEKLNCLGSFEAYVMGILRSIEAYFENVPREKKMFGVYRGIYEAY